MSFKPKLESLPEAQRALWPELAQVSRHFVLYGGTAVALHYGHRTSVDFDDHGPKLFVTSIMTAELIGEAPATPPKTKRRRKASTAAKAAKKAAAAAATSAS